MVWASHSAQSAKAAWAEEPSITQWEVAGTEGKHRSVWDSLAGGGAHILGHNEQKNIRGIHPSLKPKYTMGKHKGRLSHFPAASHMASEGHTQGAWENSALATALSEWTPHRESQAHPCSG